MIDFEAILKPIVRARMRADEAAIFALHAMSDVDLGIQLLAMAREARRVLEMPRPGHNEGYAASSLLWHFVPVLAADLIAAGDGSAHLAGTMLPSCYTASAAELSNPAIKILSSAPGRNLRTWIDWFSSAGTLVTEAHRINFSGEACQAVRLLARIPVHGNPMVMALDRLLPPSPLNRTGVRWRYGECANAVHEVMAFRNRLDAGYEPGLVFTPTCYFRSSPRCLEDDGAEKMLREIGPLDHLNVRGYRCAVSDKTSTVVEIYVGGDVLRITKNEAGSYRLILKRPVFDPKGESRWDVVHESRHVSLDTARAKILKLQPAPAAEAPKRWYALSSGNAQPVYRHTSTELIAREIQTNAESGDGFIMHALAVSEDQVPNYAVRGEEPPAPAPAFHVNFEAQRQEDEPTGQLIEFPGFGPA